MGFSKRFPSEGRPLTFSSPAHVRPTPLVIAHRGASASAPENTCQALASAIDAGADMVEVDVQLTRDSHAVVFHDWNLARLASRTGYSPRQLKSLGVGDVDLDELQRFDVGSWKDRKFAGLRIPSLSELLGHARGRIALNLELKIPDRGIGERPLRHGLIRELRNAFTLSPARDLILISSFDRTVLELARAASAEWRLGILPQRGGVQATIELAERLQAWSVHLPCRTMSLSVVRHIHDRGLLVFAYTADRPHLLRRLIDAGVDGIFTNVPHRLRALIQAL
jgi:glycerophosphoryl diester phosphodiesterase